LKEATPVWKFERVKLTYLRPILTDGVKSTDRCHASIDFGFCIVTDIGISRERDDTITWSNDFGWSQFRFNLSQIDNPYCEEVTKLARTIKGELERKRSAIIDFLDDPTTMPAIVK
jgi:hypothetical protein